MCGVVVKNYKALRIMQLQLAVCDLYRTGHITYCLKLPPHSADSAQVSGEPCRHPEEGGVNSVHCFSAAGNVHTLHYLISVTQAAGRL